MIDSLIPKNLVLWRQAGGTSLGTVIAVESKRVTVTFDGDPEPRAFSLPSEVLERVRLENGKHVQVLADGQVGVVQASLNYKGLLLYKVGLPGGATKTVPEDGVRPAVITDPAERLRSGPLQTARRTNLRVAATRLLYAYQHDELSTLGNSRVELKPHQVGVVHRVANGYPHRFILADEVGLGKTIEAGLIMRELIARGVTKRILVLAPSGLVGQWQQELKTKFNLPFALYENDGLIWPHCDGFNWPHPRPMRDRRFELQVARAGGCGRDGIQDGVVRADQAGSRSGGLVDQGPGGASWCSPAGGQGGVGVPGPGGEAVTGGAAGAEAWGVSGVDRRVARS